jgi:hypothetical protein
MKYQDIEIESRFITALIEPNEETELLGEFLAKALCTVNMQNDRALLIAKTTSDMKTYLSSKRLTTAEGIVALTMSLDDMLEIVLSQIKGEVK